MNTSYRYLPLLFVALLTTACTDSILSPSTDGTSSDADGIAFSLDVQEHCDIAYEAGRTRSGAPTEEAKNRIEDIFRVRPFQGESQGLSLHTLMLPFMGIHPHTVASDIAPATRASADAIIPAGDNQLTFHDSLTIWGYTDKGRTLFNQVLLKKIRGWRSSVHWPYDQTLTGDDAGKENPSKMRFYAIAPAMETTDIQVVNSGLSRPIGYTEAPIFKYIVPNDPAEQRDLLYGESDLIDVQTLNRNDHLGFDDKTVSLRFKHLLTCLRFAQGRIPAGMEITDISLTNVKNTGTYYPTASDAVVFPGEYADKVTDVGDGNWLLDSEATAGNYAIHIAQPTDITHYTPGGISPTTSSINGERVYHNELGENVYLTNEVLFLMPQTVAATSMLQVKLKTYKQDGAGNFLTDGDGHRILKSELTLQASLGGSIWKKGFTVTYYLTIGNMADDYYLLVEPSGSYTTGEAATAPEHGTTANTAAYLSGEHSLNYNENGSHSFVIHSFRNYKNYSSESAGINNHRMGVPWKVTGFADTREGTYAGNPIDRPTWLTAIDGWNNVSGPDAKTTGTNSGESTTDRSTLNYTVEAQSAYYTVSHTEALSNNQFTVDDDFITEAGNTTYYLDLSQRTPNGNGFDNMSGSFEANRPYNTANCYIVNSPGNFKFPLVYGNAIQAGAPTVATANPGGVCVDHLGRTITEASIFRQINCDIVTATTAYDNLTSEEQATVGNGGYKQQVSLVRYGGEEHTNDITAELTWQDASALFNEPSIIVQPREAQYGYIGFTIVSSNVQPANALITLKGKRRTQVVTRLFNSVGVQQGDDNKVEGEATASDAEVLWSWHIWLTDEVLSNNSSTDASKDDRYPSYSTDTNSKIVQLKDAGGNATGKILPVNLGWVPDEMTQSVYKDREVWVEIAQTEKGSTDEDYKCIHLKIRQEAKQDLITGTSTMYQWGRPTAMPMVKHINGAARKIYNATSEITTVTTFTCATISAPEQFLQYPTRLLHATSSDKRWWETGTPAYWSSAKTLYDPCPYGYQLPQNNLFAFISLTGDNLIAAADGNKVNIWDANTGQQGQGAWVYAQAHETTIPAANRYSPIVYLPASGEYHATSAPATMADAFNNSANCYLWTGSALISDEAATRIVFIPEQQTTTAPPFAFKNEEARSYPCYALPIRPQAQ